jgi:hypothetical protein
VGKPVRSLQFQIPQSYETVHEEIWNEGNRRFLVMINANKLPRLYVDELYTERQRAVEFFGRTGDIDLYGKGWDGPPMRVGKTIIPATLRKLYRYVQTRTPLFPVDPLLKAARKVYLGPVASKALTLGRYTFSLCFENQILNGWITEKIFDCFFAGTVPVYWGAPDVERFIPRECFIDMRQFKGYGDLREYLKSLSTADISKYRNNARSFIESPGFRPFTRQTFCDLVTGIVEEDTGIELNADNYQYNRARAAAGGYV